MIWSGTDGTMSRLCVTRKLSCSRQEGRQRKQAHNLSEVNRTRLVTGEH